MGSPLRLRCDKPSGCGRRFGLRPIKREGGSNEKARRRLHADRARDGDRDPGNSGGGGSAALPEPDAGCADRDQERRCVFEPAARSRLPRRAIARPRRRLPRRRCRPSFLGQRCAAGVIVQGKVNVTLVDAVGSADDVYLARSRGRPGRLFVRLIVGSVKRNGARPVAAPLFFARAEARAGRCSSWWSCWRCCRSSSSSWCAAISRRKRIALQQAERLRNDIRNVQMLAVSWTQALRITTAANSYSVSCVTAGAQPVQRQPGGESRRPGSPIW